MKILTQEATTNYRLLDSGDGFKLEQFGSNTIVRPDNTCLWQRQLDQPKWAAIAAEYCRQGGNWDWKKNSTFKEPWLFTYHLPAKGQEKATKFVCQLRFSQSKNIGIFPEQAANWTWMTNIIHSVSYTPNVLNLFGYTGAASLCAAAAGAEVCHVDASRPAVSWARKNQELSKLDHSTIRWIVDDCTKFVTREINRGTAYDGIIIDPPAFGRDQKGNVFEFEKRIIQLLGLCQKVLKPKPLFFIFNGYAMGHSAIVLKNLLSDFYPKASIEFGELHLQEFDRKRSIPCSIFARFTMQ